MIERVNSGIPGLDKLIDGGFVKNSVNLISGSTGTGETIFGLQFIWHGLKIGENGVYISLEQEPGGSPRSLIIRKMRRTKHGSDIYPIEITKKGIVIK